MAEMRRQQGAGDVFALDIGTRSIIGIVGSVENGRLHVTAIEKENHGQRAMLDGQIEDIGRVAGVAQAVTKRLEEHTGIRLSRVCLAAAGRALKTESAGFTLELAGVQRVTDEIVSRLEAGAVSQAEEAALAHAGQEDGRYYMAGYTVMGYQLDGYPMSSLKDHSGQVLQADVVATFLPKEVVESLYAVVGRIGLEVASLTLEPIASLNAAIPAGIRLLNLVLVDIGAGTSDIAVCRDGSVVGYTMATVAGDEITEQFMRTLLVDFDTGERLKTALTGDEPVCYTDILGIAHETTPQALCEAAEPAIMSLVRELSRRILELNGKVPSAVFLAGGGSKLNGLREKLAAEMKIEPTRVAIAGNHFEKSAFAEEYDLNDPEYATPLGIAISAGLGMINDSYTILLNGETAKLFQSGVLNVRDILLMNGYRYGDLMGRTGDSLTVTLNGERLFFRGGLAGAPTILLNGQPAELMDLVHAGDSLQFTPAKAGANAARTLADLLGRDFAGAFSLNGATAALDTPLHTGDDIWADLEASPRQPQREAEKENKAEGGAKSAPAPQQPAPPPSAPALRVIMNGSPLELEPKENGEPYYLMDMLQFTEIDFQHLEKPVELKVNGVPGSFNQKLNEGDEVTIE